MRKVFREIALGFCRPSCGLIICEGNEQTICARNVNSGEVRSFSGLCDMARDVCVNGNGELLFVFNSLIWAIAQHNCTTTIYIIHMWLQNEWTVHDGRVPQHFKIIV